VRPGKYEITITVTGFTSFTTTGVELATNQVRRTNATLQVGGLSEAVNVEAHGAGAEHRPRHDLGDGRRARHRRAARSASATSGAWRARRPVS
jgi:hypothetical protein